MRQNYKGGKEVDWGYIYPKVGRKPVGLTLLYFYEPILSNILYIAIITA